MTATEPDNKAAIKLLDEWFDGEPTEPTPEPEPFEIRGSQTTNRTEIMDCGAN